ncbi:hypothetical protein NFJ02_32g82450 [Pycnococcus provasolii]
MARHQSFGASNHRDTSSSNSGGGRHSRSFISAGGSREEAAETKETEIIAEHEPSQHVATTTLEQEQQPQEEGDGNVESTTYCTGDQWMDGAWDDTTMTWKPNKCTLNPWEDARAVTDCLNTRNIRFCGDSLLRNIVSYIGKKSDPSFAFLTSWGDARQGAIDFKWTPSAFHQQCSPRTPQGTTVIHEAAWDMGTYYQGEAAYKTSITRITNNLATRTGSGIWVSLHKLHADTPACKQEPQCHLNNGPVREKAFRDMGDTAARSAGLRIFSTFMMTNNEFAAAHTGDGVHFDGNVTIAQANALLTYMCTPS